MLDNDTMADGIPLQVDPASVRVVSKGDAQRAFATVWERTPQSSLKPACRASTFAGASPAARYAWLAVRPLSCRSACPHSTSFMPAAAAWRAMALS